MTGCPEFGASLVLHEAVARIAELEAALRDCMEIAGSDCEHASCNAIIARAAELLPAEDKT